MDPKNLGKLVADGKHRIQGGHGFLKNHADAVAADLAHILGRDLEQVAALEYNFPAVKKGRGHRQ